VRDHHYRLLGGGCADLACYASLVRYSDPVLVCANVRRAIDAGFRSLKLHEIELSAIRAAREEAGLEVELMLDVNCPWTLTFG
jgi:L-alanine-DL-glutamate epimerase-like enolase superfamily enzyme